MVSLALQYTFKIAIVFHKVAIIAIYIRFTSTVTFDLLISSDSLIFLLLYLDSLDNVFGCNQLNWQWHFKQHFVAPKLLNFPLMLSWWCLIVLVITFVSPMYSPLQLWLKRVFIWHCLLVFFSSKQSLEQVTLRVSWGEFRIK